MASSPTPAPLVSISIVSHNQARLVNNLLADIDRYCGPEVEVLLTINVLDEQSIDPEVYSLNIKLISNKTPKGFGANHNAALKLASGKYYCVLNPDIRFMNNPLPELLACLSDPSIGIVAPLVTRMSGTIEDTARRFPTPLSIAARALFGKRPIEYGTDYKICSPDWVGGMFMLIPAAVFRRIGGFDERYFLYYEDVDLCARMRLAGYDIRLCPNAKVIHEARRQSHRDLRYFRWHLASILRFFFSKPFLMIMWRRRKNGKP
jgi:GT2 family glycosyltransferase